MWSHHIFSSLKFWIQLEYKASILTFRARISVHFTLHYNFLWPPIKVSIGLWIQAMMCGFQLECILISTEIQYPRVDILLKTIFYIKVKGFYMISNWMQHILILSFVLSNVFPSEPKIKFGKWFSERLSDMYPCQYPPREWGFISSKIRGPKANIFDTSNPQPLRIGAVASNIYIIVLKQWANFLTFQGFILSKEK